MHELILAQLPTAHHLFQHYSLEISLSQDAKGIITSRPYLLSDEQTSPVSFLKEHVTSMVVAL